MKTFNDLDCAQEEGASGRISTSSACRGSLEYGVYIQTREKLEWEGTWWQLRDHFDRLVVAPIARQGLVAALLIAATATMPYFDMTEAVRAALAIAAASTTNAGGSMPESPDSLGHVLNAESRCPLFRWKQR